MNFSVLVCLYARDNADWFRMAMESIYSSQQKKPDEIVLVIDGPIPSKLEEVVDELSNSEMPLKIIRNKNNIGLPKSLNIGLLGCSYELVARMDSDDISHPCRFSEQLGYMKSNPDVDVISSTVRDIDLDGNILGHRALPTDHAEIFNYAKFRSPINHGCCIYKKEKVLSIGGYRDLRQCQDYVLFINLLANGCIMANLPQVHMDVRFPEGYQRKRGLAYVREEVLIFPHIRKISSLQLAVLAVALRIFIRLLPPSLINLFYKSIRAISS